MFTQDPETICRIANKQATDDLEARKRAKKYGKSSDSGDGEFLGAVIIITDYVCYKAVGWAVKVTTTGSKILVNAYKINTGKIEVLGTDPESKTTYIARNPSPCSTTSTTESLDSTEQVSPRSKREKVKILEKQILENAKTGAKILSTAYKLTTGKVEVLGLSSEFTRDGKEKFIFSEPTERKIVTKEFKLEDGYTCGIAWEEIINTSLTLRLNNNLVFKFKEFRSVVLPDTTQDTGKTFDISLVLKDS
ncbi:hypothetical protein [Rickettsia tamurae]|uniref:hypothetical protein n=1 Tax=Rickettsia tamurae TaxID=334545 RepID=UPI000B17177E|nr:hypothetical protein [Rickettsia tamurae]